MFREMNWITAAGLGFALVTMMAGMAAVGMVLYHNRRYRKLREQNRAWSQWEPPKNPSSSKPGT